MKPDATDEDCLDVLHRAAAHSLLQRADRRLDTVIGEGGMKISGGEKQRLSIARALLRRPQLLVFDEATSALDSLTEEEIGRTMREVSVTSNVITVMIAHRLSTIMHADRIYVLERGRIAETGRHEKARRREGVVLRDVAAAGGGAARGGNGAASSGRRDPGVAALAGA